LVVAGVVVAVAAHLIHSTVLHYIKLPAVVAVAVAVAEALQELEELATVPVLLVIQDCIPVQVLAEREVLLPTQVVQPLVKLGALEEGMVRPVPLLQVDRVRMVKDLVEHRAPQVLA
jgi:hypothetical protein